MNRIIKFRGKNKKGEWIYGDLMNEQIHDGTFYGEDGSFEWWGEEVDPETIGQFTGLTDVNGKEIYEGDILRVNECDKVTALVVYDVMGFKIVDTGAWVNTNKGWVDYFQFAEVDNKFEVICNIHDKD